ncbi:MAG: hypothetical protein ACREQ5_01280 [Candidatus Dormibacteria bacterium]
MHDAPADSARRYKLQRESLKWLLVCCFGYAGYKNARFGKIEAHEAINAVARDYQKASLTAIAAQQLFGSNVKLRTGQVIEYVITDADAAVSNDRVRAYALWEGWQGYDKEKYRDMLREAFELFLNHFSRPPSSRLNSALARSPFTKSLTSSN